MIPVKPAPEPDSFDKKVRIPGKEFLMKIGIRDGKPSDFPVNWDGHDYWRNCSDELVKAYNSICCYVAMRINRCGTKDRRRSVEHFIPKSKAPWLAYEWSNYRLACIKANQDRENKHVIDPFDVAADDFRLSLCSGELYPNPKLPNYRINEIKQAIANVKLNDSYWKRLRVNYYNEYNKLLKDESHEMAEKFLEKTAPIVLAELKRNIKPIVINDN